jgi:hypothetical protein
LAVAVVDPYLDDVDLQPLKGAALNAVQIAERLLV